MRRMRAPSMTCLVAGALALAAMGGGCKSNGDGASTGKGGASASGAGGAAGASGGVTGGAGAATAGTGGGAGASAGSGGASGASGSGGAGGAGGSGGGGGASGSGGASGAGGRGGAAATGGANGADAGATDASPDAGGAPRIVLVAGTGTGGDGSPATSARVLNPYGAVVDPITGDVYIAEVDTGKIRHIDGNGTITTVVGPGAPGSAASIKLNQPHDLLFQPGTRTLFIADTMNGNVYRLRADTGEVAMFVGQGASFPNVTRVYCLAFSPTGTDLYYTTPTDIRVVDLGAMVSKPAINYPDARVIAVDSRGTLYAVKNRPNGDALQIVDATGKPTDIAATANVVSDPKHLAVEPDDNILIADTELFLVRRYTVASGTLSTLVGNGVSGTGTLGGAPMNAQLKRPHGVFADKAGVIYISDSENNRVLKIVR